MWGGSDRRKVSGGLYLGIFSWGELLVTGRVVHVR